MATSVLPRTALSSCGLWCWQATLAAFGIASAAYDGGCPPWFTIYELQRHGYTVTSVVISKRLLDPTVAWKNPTVSEFIREHPEGDYVITTRGHVMALQGGQLTDTDLTSTGRRWVITAHRVERH